MKHRPRFWFPLALLALLAVGQCAGPSSGPVHMKDGEEYGKVHGAFRNRWWNYYERGLSYADGAFCEEAAADLQEAISQREKDQRMARTYGMHFVDYFPHRELGIVHFQKGNLEEARAELETSLGQFPSAKARFYLDRVREKLIEREAREVTPPRLLLDLKADEVWTRDDPVVVSGMAEDEHYVSAVSLGGASVFMEGSRKRVSFEEPLSLSQGRHRIVVEARNLAGKTTRQELVIHADREGPVVTFEEIEPESTGTGGSRRVSGSVYDEAGVSALTINGRSVAVNAGTDVPFVTAVTGGETEISVLATDRLGNETSAEVVYGTPAQAARSVRLAWAESEKNPLVLAGLFGSGDTVPPVIELKDWAAAQTVLLEKIYIEGQASDQTKIVALSINGTPILRHEGVTVFFSYLAELKKGENSLLIEAADEAGNTARQEILIVREIPTALQLAERLSLTVLPFEQRGVVSETSLAFEDSLVDSLVDQERFRVVERQKLDAILQEQKLSRSKLIDRDTALQLGKLVAANSIITGSMIETRTGIEIVARFIDTETSEILETEDVYGEVKDLPGLRKLAEGMAIKFHIDFPLLQGLVVERKGNNIFTDLGEDKIKLQRRLLVYREEPIKHPVTGKILGADNVIVGRARVNQVMADMSKAELLDGDGAAVKRLDKVITE
jgi:TolB-like protein